MVNARNVGFLSATAEPRDRMLSARLVWNGNFARDGYELVDSLEVSNHTRDNLLKAIGQAEASFEMDARELMTREVR